MKAGSIKPRKSTSVAPAKRQRAKRMPAEARKAVILAEASDFFARHGFEASTRDLADRIGVRQALLYKYFPSKDALIEAVFDLFIGQRREHQRAVLVEDDQATPFNERVFRYYGILAHAQEATETRLAIRAMLEDMPQAGEICDALAQNLTKSIIAEVRRAEGLPGLDKTPMKIGEAEAVRAFHAGALYITLRRHMSVTPILGDPDDAIRSHIEIFMAGFRHVVRDIHQGKWKSSSEVALNDGAAGPRPKTEPRGVAPA